MPRTHVARGIGAVALFCAVVALGAGTTISSSVRLMANAYVMDGTTFPTPSQGFVQSAIDDFIVPTVGGSYTGIPLTTPEGVIGIDTSVQGGVDALDAAIRLQQQEHPDEPFVAFGFSQSSVIQTYEKIKLEQQGKAPNVTFVGIGVGNRPNGGIAERLSGLTIPFFDFTFNGAAPNDTGLKTIDIVRQYDGLGDTPEFIANPVALANALLGIVFVHVAYGEEVSLDPASPKYVKPVVQQKGDTTYYFIPTAQLPLLDPLRLIGVPEGVLDVVQPLLKVLVEAGYDRSVPFYEPTPASLLPTLDPATFAVQLAAATLDGANNAAKLAGATLPGYAELAKGLAQLETTSATTIGKPYGDVVRDVNKVFNPITAFSAVEGPIARTFDAGLNATGAPKALNQAIQSVLTPLTSYIERNVFFPKASDSTNANDPAAVFARQLLKPVFPHLSDAPKPPTLRADTAAAATTPTTETKKDSSRPARKPEPRSPKPDRDASSSHNDSTESKPKTEDTTTKSKDAKPKDTKSDADGPKPASKRDHPRQQRSADRAAKAAKDGSRSAAA